MPRSKPKDLTINPKIDPSQPIEPAPNSSPIEFEGIDLSSMDGGFGSSGGHHQESAGFSALPPLPASPSNSSPAHSRNQSSGNLLNKGYQGGNNNNNKAAAGGRLQDEQRGMEIRRVPREREQEDDAGMPATSSSMSKIYHIRQNGSTPQLSFLGSKEDVGRPSGTDAQQKPRRERPQLSPKNSEDSTTSAKRKENKRFGNGLIRSRSVRRDSDAKKQNGKISVPDNQQPLRTAPLQPTYRGSQEDMRGKLKDKRGKSADRTMVVNNASRDNLTFPENDRPAEKVKGKDNFVTAGGKTAMSGVRKGGNNLKTFLNKIGRSGSNSEKVAEVPDSEYVLKTINLPLVEQTRITRISKRLSDCKDKTEFWMPALPWRCIDFLNLNCESEGLYRIPGSGPQVKSWQRRFDTEHDIDLLNEKELYDPNNIGSMLKTWLRELPTEIMPSDLQNSLAKELARDNVDYSKVGQKTPQRLRDALSELSPFNYYLLFAITCHLSLLLSHKDQNRMDLHNLAICIGPCLKLDRWLFNYLVGDWRHCWQGCYTEKQALEDEKLWEMQHNLPGQPTNQGLTKKNSSIHVNYRPSATGDSSTLDERAISSGASSLHDVSFSSTHASRGGGDHDWETIATTTTTPSSSDRRPATSHDPSVRRPTGSDSKPPHPHALETRKGSEEGSSATRTPRQNAHARSQSELLPPTPTRIPRGAPAFPMRDDS